MNNRVIKNASWIIVCKAAQSIVAIVLSAITARYLGPADFGVINYAASIVSFVVPIMYLGINAVLVHELIENKAEDEGKILGTAIVLSVISALLCMGGIFAFVNVVNSGESVVILVTALYSTLLLFQAIDLIQYWFQAKLLSRYTSIFALIAYLLVSIYKILLLMQGKNVFWFAITQPIDYMIIAISLLIVYKRQGGNQLVFDRLVAKRLLSKGKYYIISGLMVNIYAQTDRIMLKLLIDDVSTGYYAAAITCVGYSSFLFTAIIDSCRPIILENYKKNKKTFEESLMSLYSIVFYLSLLQGILMSLLATVLVTIMFGVAYLPSAEILRILVWYSMFSYIGGAKDIWVLAEGKQKYLLILNISGVVVNIVMNISLIPILGPCGAAIATLCTQLLTNIVIGLTIPALRRNSVLILRSIYPKVLLMQIFRSRRSVK